MVNKDISPLYAYNGIGNPPMGTVDIIIGKVVAVHIADWALTDGILDVRKTMPIARCGYYQYAVIKETFEMMIPGDSELLRIGLEGNSKASKEHTATAQQLKRSQSTGAGAVSLEETEQDDDR